MPTLNQGRNMNLNEFCVNFAEAVELPAGSIEPDSVFRDLPIWDSLSLLNVIAMVDIKYSASLTGDQIEQSNNVRDLYSIINAKSL